ncbi:MAG: hypothetical protein COC12_06225 [Rhodobacteraceae bacterium]|nr:MAG: hypothetical protein COC12_06225 [Paracoccaceae bacterium]
MPYPDNTPSMDEMLNLPIGELAQMPVELLSNLQGELAHASKQLKAATARFNAALDMRYATRATEARRACGKDTGTVRLGDGDFTVVADLPKRVSWDQERLTRIAANIAEAGDDPAEFIESTLKVPERKYTALPASWRKGFEAARKVGSGKPTFRLEAAEQS